MAYNARKAALQHILHEAEAGRIGPGDGDFEEGCSYRYDSGNHCAVGCILPKSVIEEIQENELNGDTVLRLEAYFGEGALRFFTGLPYEDLETLQHEHDKALGEDGVDAAIQAVIKTAKELLMQPSKV